MGAVGYEIDFLPVGDGERSGDAIAVRFGDLYGARDSQFVMVIDGGTKASGQALADHIRRCYDTNFVDLVLSTHPDADHVSGLTMVLDQLEVGELWMHLPWDHAADIRALFRDGRITDCGLRERLRRALQNARDLEEFAIRKGISIREPFSDDVLPHAELGLRVLGPTRALYESLLPHFRETPEPRIQGVFKTFATGAAEVVKWVGESWLTETLTDPDIGSTSAENNTSVVLLLEVGGHQLLFTGDAGVIALTGAADHADLLGVQLPSARFVQVPHHGSRRNVGPTILNRILGPMYPEAADAKLVFVSAAKESAKHPSRKVTNAFQRRGAKGKVFSTKGNMLLYSHDAPDRGWRAACPLPFYDQVEE